MHLGPQELQVRIRRLDLLYDSDCGFCRWSLGKVLGWDRSRRLRPVAIQSPEGQRLLADLSPADRLDSWHLLDMEGKRASAGAAFTPLLRQLPGGKPFAWLTARLPGATERAYRLISGRRTKLGPLLSAGAKRRADARIAERQT